MGSQCCKCASANTKHTSASSAGSTLGTRGDQELVGDRYRYSENNNTVHLSLQHVTQDDVGYYALIAKNAAGEARGVVELRLDDAPAFLRRLSDLAVKVGTRTRFLVEIRSSSDVKVTWHHNDHMVEEGERFTFLHEGNFFCVDVAPVMVEDGGHWTCMAENSTGRSSCSSHLNVLVPKAYKSPEFLEELKALLTEQGTVSLECKVVGVPTPVLHWYKDGKEIKAGDIFALTANPDDPTSLGTYTCEAVNCMGKTYSSSRVHVMGKGSREGSLKPADSLRPAGPAPVFTKELLPIKTKIGDTIILACKVTVPPWPKSIAWYNHEGRVENNDKYHVMEDGLGGYMLEVCPVEAADEGEWKCVATSSEGAKGISKTQVSVSYPKNFRKPRFLESLKAILTEEGLVSFECKVVGFPTPQLRWFKDGQELRPGDVYQLTGTNSLGSYSCIAKNCMGEATSSAELTVEDIQNQLNEEERLQLFSTNQPPKFIQGLKSCEGKINEEFRFTVQVSISPEPTVSWYRDDEHIFESDHYHVSRETLGHYHLDMRFLEIIDQAEWKCVATNEFGHSVTSCFLKLNIPKHFKKPRFLECLRAILSEEGAVNLECKVIGVPQPVLKWYKDGEELKPGDIHRIISGQDGTCCLGTYTCEAHNCMGTVASSASLLGFEDRMLMKSTPQRQDHQSIIPAGHVIARNPSLSTIHEERTSQMYDTPATERSLTMDERPEISFSFDGKEVSVSLYETPDLTEEEALQVVEMYAEQLSEHVSEHNVVDLPPMRFVKESSHSGKLLMEAVVIDVTGDYFTSAEDDLRTDADVEELSITDDPTQQAPLLPPDLEDDDIPFDRLNAEFLERALAPTVPYPGSEEVSPPKRPPRRKSETNRPAEAEQGKQSSDTYHSISPSKGANGVGKSPQAEDERSEAYSDAQASEVDTPSKYETFASARGSIPKAKDEVAREEEKWRTEPQSTKSSPPELVRNIELETKKRKGSASEESEGKRSDPKMENSTQTGSLKKKVRSVESGQGDSFENIVEIQPDGTGVQKQEHITRKGSQKIKGKLVDTQSGKSEESPDGKKKQQIPMESDDRDTLLQKEETQRIDKDDSYSEEGDGLKTRGIREVDSGMKKKEATAGEQKVKSKTIKKKGSKRTRSTESVEAKIEEEAAAPMTLQAEIENIESQKQDSVSKKKRLSAVDLDLPTLAAPEESKGIPVSQSQKSESGVLEALTRSLQDIQRGLTSVEEKVISESIEEPASAISSLSVLETLSQPIQDIQKGLALVEQHSASSSEEHSPGKTGLILETLSQPIQEFQRGLQLVEQQVITEKGEESLLERTSASILENVAQPVEELRRGIALIQQQAILESGIDMPDGKAATLPTTVTQGEIQSHESTLQHSGSQILQAIIQPVQELQSGMAMLQQQALLEVKGELSAENAGIRILSTLEKPLQELKRGVALVEQQVVLEDIEKSNGGKVGITILEAVVQPIQDLQRGIALVEQQAVIEAEDGFEPDIMRYSILKTLSQPIQELQNSLSAIKEMYTLDVPATPGIEARHSPVLETLEESIQQLTREIVTIAKLSVLKSKSDSEPESLATLGNLAPPLLKLQKQLVQVEKSIVFENLQDPKTSSVALPSLKMLAQPLTEFRQGLTEIEQQLECESSEEPMSKMQHITAMEALSNPIQDLKKGISDIQRDIISDATASMTNASNLESLIKPFQELQRGLIKVEQVVLEAAPDLIPEKGDLPVVKALTLSVQDLGTKIVSMEKATMLESNEPKRIVVSKLSNLTQPLLHLKKGLIQVCQNIQMSESSDLPRQEPSSPILGFVLQPLLQLQKGLDEIEHEVNKLQMAKSVENTCTEEVMSMVEPIENIKKGIKAIQRQAVLEPMSTNITVLETLVKPLGKLQRKIDNLETTTSETPGLTVLQNVTKSIIELQEGINSVEMHAAEIQKEDVGKANISKLGLLKEPLKELSNQLSIVEKQGLLITGKETTSNVITMSVLMKLSEPLQELQQDIKKIDVKIQSKEEPGLSSIQLQFLTEPIQELQKSIAVVQYQAVLESGVVTDQASPSILETLFHPLQMLQKSLVAIESQSVEPVCKMSSSATIQAAAQTLHELQEEITSLENRAVLEPGFDNSTLSVVGCLKDPMAELQRGLVVIEQHVLRETVSEPQSEIANLSALENLVGPLKQLQSEITKIEKQNKDNQSTDASTLRKANVSALEALYEPIQDLQKVIDTIQQKALLETEPVYGKAKLSILQVLAQPLQEIYKSLSKIEEVKTAVIREEQAAKCLHMLENVSQNLQKLQQKVASIEKCTKTDVKQDPKKVGLTVLGTLTAPLQELSQGLTLVQDQIQSTRTSECLPEISTMRAVESLAKPMKELQTGLVSLENFALEPMAEPLAKKARATAVKAITQSIQELKKHIAVVQQQAVLESGTLSISASPSVLETLFKPLQKLQKCLSVVEECKLSTPQKSKILEMGTIMVLDNVAQSIQDLQGEIVNLEQKASIQTKEGPKKADISMLGALSQPLLELQEGLKVMEHKVIETGVKLVPQTASLSAVETLAKPLQEFVEKLAEVGHQQLSESTEVLSLQKLNSSTLEALAKPITELEKGIALIQQQTALEATEQGKLDESFLVSIAQPIQNLKEKLTIMKEIVTIETTESMPEQTSLSAVKALLHPIEELRNSVTIMEQEAIMQGDEKSLSSVSLLQSLAQPLQELESHIALIEQQAVLEGSEEPISEKINISMLKEIAIPVEQIIKAMAVIEQQVILEAGHLTPAQDLTSKMTKSLAEPILELQKGLAQVEQQVVLEADDAPLSDDINISSLKTLAQHKEEQKRDIALSELCIALEPREESMSEKTSMSALQTLAQPLNELEKGLARIEQQVILEANEPLSEKFSMSILETLAQPVQDLQRSIVLITHQAVLEAEGEDISAKIISALKTLAQPIHELHKDLVQIEHQVLLDTKEIMPEQTNLSVLQTIAQPIQELHKAIALIGHQVAIGPCEEPMSDKTDISALRTLAEPLQEITKSLAQIEQQVALDVREESMSEKTNLSVLKTLAQPMHELEKGLALIEQQTLLSQKEEPMSEKTNVSALKTLAEPLHEIQKSLAQIEQQVVLEAQGESMSDKTSISLLEMLAHPVEEMQRSIAFIEQQAALETGDGDISEKNSTSALQTLANPMIELQRSIAQIEQQVVLEAKEETISDQTLISSLKTLADLLQEAQRSIAVTEQQTMLEPKEDSMSDQTSISKLRTLAEPLQEIQHHLVQIEQQVILHAQDEPASETSNLSLLKTLAHPVQEIQRGIALIDQQIVLEASGKSISEKENFAILQAIAQPIEELHRGIAQIEHQVALEAREESMSDKTSLSLLKALAQPIHEKHQGIAVAQEETVLEDGEALSEQSRLSLLETLANPIHQLYQELAVIEQLVPLESKGEPLSEKEDVSALKTLAQPIQEIYQGLAQIEQQIVLESGIEQIAKKDNLIILQSLAQPIHELQRGIAVIEQQALLEAGEKTMSTKADISLIKALAKPLQELERGIVMIAQQVPLEGVVQSMSEDGTIVSDLPTLASSNEVSQGVLNIEEQWILEGDVDTLSDRTDIKDIESAVSLAEEPERMRAIAQHQAAMEHLGSVLDVLESAESYKISDDGQKTTAAIKDVCKRGHAIVEEQQVLSGAEILEVLTDRPQGTFAAVRTVTERGVVSAEAQETLTTVTPLESFKLDPSVNIAVKETSERGLAVGEKQEVLMVAEEYSPFYVADSETKVDVKLASQLGLATTEQQEVLMGPESVIVQNMSVEEANVHQSSFLGVPEIQQIEHDEHAETLSNIESLSKEEYVLESDASLHEAAAIEEQEALMQGVSIETVSIPMDQMAKATEMSVKEAVQIQEQETLSSAETLTEDIRVLQLESEAQLKSVVSVKETAVMKESAEVQEPKITSKEKSHKEEIEIIKKEKEAEESKCRKEEEESKKNKEALQQNKNEQEEAKLMKKGDEMKVKNKNEEAKHKEMEEGEIKQKVEDGLKKEEDDYKVEEEKMVSKMKEDAKVLKEEEVDRNTKGKEGNKRQQEQEIKKKDEDKLEHQKEEKGGDEKKEKVDANRKVEEEHKKREDILSESKKKEEEVLQNTEKVELDGKEKEQEECKRKKEDKVEDRKKKEEKLRKADEDRNNEIEKEEQGKRKKKEEAELKKNEDDSKKEEEHTADRRKKKEEEEQNVKEEEETESKKKEELEIKSKKEEERRQEEEEKVERKRKENKEAERKEKVETELKKKEKEEVERKKKEEEEIEHKKKEKEGVERKKKEEKEIEHKKKEKEEIERKKKEEKEIEHKKKEKEEVERKKKEEEEIEHKKKEKEEVERKEKEEEEIVHKKKEKEEVERKKKEEEEIEHKKNEKEEVERKELEEAELERKKKEEAEMKKKKKEEEELKKKEKEEAKRKKKEDEEAERKRKKDVEEELKKNEKEKAKCKKKEEEEIERAKKADEEIKKKKEEDTLKKKEKEESERKKEEEETERKKKEEVDMKKKKEEELMKKEKAEAECKKEEDEEAERRKKEEVEIKKKKEDEEAERKKKEEVESKKEVLKKENEEAESKKEEEETECKKKEEVDTKKKKEKEELKKKEKAEAERKKEDEEAERKKKEEVEMKKKKEDEEAEQRKKEEVQNKKEVLKKKENDEAEHMKKEQEKAERVKNEEELKQKGKEEEKAERKKMEEEEVEHKKKQEKENKKLEAERKKKEEEEAERKKKEEAEEKKKKEEEEQKKEEEDAKRKKEEVEEAERKKKDKVEEEGKKKEKEVAESKKEVEEEAERKRKHEVENKKKKEEEERKKKEEAESKKKEEEEAERKKKEEVENKMKKEKEERKKKYEEEAESKKKEEEEAERKKKEEVENKKKKEEEELMKKEKEEAERNIKEKEEAKRKKEEKAESKKKTEEELKTKEKEDVERKKKEEEAERKKKEDEAERKKKEEAENKKEEEELKNKEKQEMELKKKEEEDAERKKKEEVENKTKKEEEERKKKEKEELERKEKEEVETKKKKEKEELKKKEKEEVERKKKEDVEAERKKKEEEENKKEERKKIEKQEAERKKKEEEDAERKREEEVENRKKEEELKKKEKEELERKKKEEEESERKKKEEVETKKKKEELKKKEKEDVERKKKEKLEAEVKKKKEAENKKKEEEERKKKEKQEAELKKKEEKDAERKKEEEVENKRKKEEKERKKKEEEELERKKKEEGEAERKKKEDVETKKKKEKEELKKKEKAEAERKKKEEEEAERKKKEEAENKKQEEERKKKEKQEVERKEKQEAENKKQEEERKKKEKQEVERKKKEEEDAERKKEEEVENEKKKKKKKEEEEKERKKKEKVERKKKEEEEEAERKKMEEIKLIKKKKEEDEQKKKDETERKKKEEDAEQKKKEEVELRQKEENEREKKEKEEADRKKKEEDVKNKKKDEERAKEAKEHSEKGVEGEDDRKRKEGEMKMEKDVDRKKRDYVKKKKKDEADVKKVKKDDERKTTTVDEPADVTDSVQTEQQWVINKISQRTRSFDQRPWNEEESMAPENSFESSDTLTTSETSSTLTPMQRSRGRTTEDRSLASLEELPSDANRRRSGPREKVESGPRDFRKKPVFCTRLTDRTAAQGSRIKLTCSVLGSPEPVIQWLRDGLPLDIGSNDRKYRAHCEDGLANLEVLDSAPGDSAEYTCVARNLHGETSSTAALKVYAGFEPAPFPPTFTRAIKDTYRVADDELVLECRVRSQPAPRITWLKNGAPLPPSTHYQQSELADGVCRLVITAPEPAADSGHYTCRAQNALWSDQISAAINFAGRDQFITSRRAERANGSRVPRDVRRPHFTSVLTDHLVPSGGTIALQVEVRGAPKPEVTWMRGSENLPTSPKFRTFEEAGIHTLMVADASELEAGMYTCRALNTFGQTDTTAAVQVVPPGSIRGGKTAMFVSRPDNVMAVAIGEDITVSFRVTGDPKPRVTWMKGTRDITNSQRSLKETIDDYVRLTLKRALLSDVGTYCILAKNVYGCDRSFVTVRIRQRARSLTPGGERRLQDTANILRDVREELERSRLRDVPGAVSGEPVVTDSGRNWLTLSWPKSEHRGGVPVLAYRVEAWELGDAGGAKWTEMGVSPINSFDAFNLKPGCEYQFRVTPRNRYGWGESVTTSNPVMVGKPVELPEFIRILPGQLKALRGANIRLECQVRGDPIPEVRWYRDGTELDFRRDPCPRFSTSFTGSTCRMDIQDLQDEDSGRYMCEATNKEGRVSTFARLLVVSDPKIWEADTKLKRGILEDEGPAMDSPPQFTMRLRDRRVQMTYPVRLTCQVVGQPSPELTWSKDGVEVKQDERHTFWNEEHFHTLELSHTTLEDSGCYSATAKNSNGAVSCRCHLVVDKGIRAYVAPEFVFELEPEFSVKEGGNLRFSAQVEAYPTVGVMWHRDGVRLRPSRRTIMTLDHDGTVELALAGVTTRDAGVYSCTATNEVGRSETSTRVSVLVSTPPPTAKPPQVIGPEIPYSKVPLFVTKPRSTEAVEGDTVIIHCEVVGDPKPEVMWLRDWLKPDYYRDAPHFRRVGDGPEYRLEIPRAKLDYTGAYSVIARNCHGEAKAVISLQIYAKGQGKQDKMESSSVKHGKVQTLPVIKRELKDLRCCDGDAVTLECRVHAIPTPDIRWEKGGRLVPLGGDFSADFDGETASLSIHQVFPEDEGEYTCVVYNDLGRALTSACLVVDVPEEKETLLSRQLSRPPGLLSAGSTPRSTPRTTPSRSKSPSLPRFRDRDVSLDTSSRPRRLKVAAPKFYAIPHNRVAEEGETVRFQCAIAGHPTPWVTWDKDGLLVTPSARLTLSERDDLRVLEVAEVTPEDAGLYRVTLENEVGRVEASARLEVIGRHGSRSRGIRAWSASPRTSPTFGRRLIGTTARLGGRMALACDLRGSPSPAPTWYRNGELVVRSDRVTPTWDGRTARLEVEMLDPSDAGVYTCVAENEAGKTRCSAKVDILEVDDTSDRDRQPPEFLQGLPEIITAADGQPLELQVRLQGTPPIDVVWVKDDSEIPDCDDLRYVDYGDGRVGLRLADVFPQDAGEYRCEAYSPHGDAVTGGRLIVKESSTCDVAPRLQFTKKPTPVLVAQGGSAAFCARLQTDDPAATLLCWNIAGRPVHGCSRYQVEEQGDVSILHVSSAEPGDAGVVTCCASLDSGESVSCSSELVVQPVNKMSDATPAMLLRGPADTTALRGDRVMLKATFVGWPEPEVRWLRAGRELSPNERVIIITEDGVSCLVLENITADDSGKYVVSVENELGADCHFASVAVEGPPDPPAGRPSVSSNECGAVVAWSSAPYDGGCMVTGFSLEMRAGAGDWQQVAHGCHSLSHVVRDLTPGESYVFRVRAENVHGESEPSAESSPFSFQFDVEDECFTPAFEPRLVTVEPGDEFKSLYEVMEELGKGRYGVVHKVMEHATGQKFAAKFIRCIKAKDREKVQEEIDIMNCLCHPKLLQLAAAFESPREVVMVMEYISGGELFERVVADDFTLTERDCILFMRQICEGVDYMHKNLVVHLDLKPENIMCHTRTSHQIKLIDFGLARKLQPDIPVRVLFGTPEFIPPEIINYEPIGIESDMWSVGVICYVLLSGLSPFMGDNDAETFANITRADYDFEDEAFDAISQDAKDFISNLLLKRKEKRLTAKECLQHIWLAQRDDSMSCVKLSTDKLKKFIIRRKWQLNVLKRQPA